MIMPSTCLCLCTLIHTVEKITSIDVIPGAARNRHLTETYHFAVEGLHSLAEAAGKAIGLHCGLLKDLLQSRVEVEDST